MVGVFEIYLSELSRSRVMNAQGEYVGKLKDIAINAAETFPILDKVIIKKRNGKEVALPWKYVDWIENHIIKLKKDAEDHFDEPPMEGLYLLRDVQDKQIVDVYGKKLVRVNDLKIAKIEGIMHLVAADIGTRGIFRRLDLDKAVAAYEKVTGRKVKDNLLSWEYVEPLPPDIFHLKLNISQSKLSQMHPADLADIVSQLSVRERTSVIGSLDDETAADTIHEFEPDMQVSILSEFSDERASDILESMEPDDAADILGDLPKERADSLLDLMEPEEAQDVRELLAWPEDSAGGLMTNEFVSLLSELSSDESIKQLREIGKEIDTIYYIYIIDEFEHLLGVLSLKDLITSHPEMTLGAIMHTDVLSVLPDEPQAEVARLIAKYDLLAIPVVDETHKMLGIVTVDDAIDTIIPTVWKKKLPKIFHT